MTELLSVTQSLSLPDPGASPVSRAVKRDDGKFLHILDWGGEGQPVLFFHGGMLCAHTWDLVCALLRNDYRCLSVDLRGHGESDWAESYFIPDHVTDVERVIEELELDNPHFVGMSLGGIVASHTTLKRAGKNPASLTLVDMAPGFSMEDTGRIRDFAQSSAVQGGVPALMEQARAVGGKGTDELLAYRYKHLIRQNEDGSWRWKFDTRQAINFPDIFAHVDLLDSKVDEVTWPCLVVRGGISKILSSETAEAFANKCPRGSWAVVEEAGHTVQEDNPAGLAQALREFWSSI